ncbi:MAG: phytochelatin synthase family protein, partial [Nitrososphaera sp.]|nr:phytochelatin synthase family protein [Nitrososphaera sp.]
ASSVMVLNALRVPDGEAPANPTLAMKMPEAWGGDTKQYHFYTQETFFNEKTEKIKPRSVVMLNNVTARNTKDGKAFDPGLQLAQLKSMLEAHNAEVVLKYADKEEKAGVEEFREDVKRVLSEDKHFLIVNLLGTPLGMNSSGHISPVSAYDPKTDSVLILEVAATKRPWLWVPVRDLYLSMHTKDGEQFRGYLIVSDPEQT